MTVRASGQETASAARTEADAALLAWQRGNADPQRVIAALTPIAATAADHSNLGVVLRVVGRLGDAEAAYRTAIRQAPSFAAAHYNLGNLLSETTRLHDAILAYRAALTARPDYPEAWNGLGLVLQRLVRLPEAAAAFANAVRHAPSWTDAHTNLGLVRLAQERYEDALSSFQAALALNPSHVAALGNLSALLLRAGRPVAAEDASRKAIALAPGEHRWHANLAVALQMQARHEEAEQAYRHALDLRPDYAGGHGNLLFALNYRDDLTADVVFAEYRRWDEAHARPHYPAQRPAATPAHGRRLRIGYVSPDFRQHAVALFTEPLLAAHDRQQVEIFCYAELLIEDETTVRFRALADHWRATAGHDDATVAQMIRDDGIDVLIDLGGHTASSRLTVFARKPAPVQIAYMVGHGYTSGLSAMDVFLADDNLAPPGTDALFSERLVRLPRIPIAYRPPAAMPAISPLPALAHGHVTFGHFGRPERLNRQVIAAWSRILHAVPGARLVLDNRSFQEPAFRDLFAARFAAHGITTERLTLTYTTPQAAAWAAYSGIDIALDPFPHNAGTTTIEALWMGVPVVSLASRPTVGRFGASILGALDLHDWVADTPDAYVDRAIAAATDLPALADLRVDLRQRFEASPLYDAAGLARCLETVCRDLHAAAVDEAAALRQAFLAGNHGAAAELAQRILARDANNGLAAHVAGLMAYQQARYADADRLLRITVASADADPEPHANHAAILRKLGRLAEAEQAARTALAIAPTRGETHNNLGNILRDAGRLPEAAAAFQAAIRLAPDFADAWANLAWVWSLSGQALEAERAARKAIDADPRNPNGHNNLGLALMRQSRLREAEDALREALRLKPDFALAHSNILFCLNYRDDWTPEAIFAEYQTWDRRHARPLMPDTPAWDIDRTPGRRLRVGYVSPDFRHHAVALFAEPLLAAHDRTRIELFCYAEVAVGDATTERFRAMADHWRPTIGLDDAAVAEMIRRDRIDILVDLAGHTAGNRLLAFARRPAPVQIEFMLGHGYTSGLSAIDAFLADAALAPPDSDGLFSEAVIRLPRIPLAYRPPDGMPDVGPLPARSAGRVTFGYFGRTVRLNDDVIAAWSQILHAVPGSRLMLNNSPFAEAAGCDLMAARFAAHGIARDRLVLVCTAPQPVTWAAYGQVDIALDPFPHNAGTTTIEALWMGVPVVTLAGRPTVGRFGAAILHAVGLDDWVTAEPQAYVTRAARAAGDLDALERLRAALRPTFRASPLHDASGLARAIEQTYQDLWDIGPEGEAPRLRHLYQSGAQRDALVLADRLLRRNPRHADALHIRALAAYRDGNATQGVELLRRAPPRVDLLTDLGVLHRANGDHSAAEASYRHALRLVGQFAPALGNLGNLLLDTARPAEAEVMFRDALDVAPDQPWLLRGLALALLARQDNVGAEAALRQALDMAPDDAEAHETLGCLCGQTGRPIEAEVHHRAALPTLRQRHRCLGNLAVALQTQGRHEEAEDCYRQALAAHPGYASGHGNLLFALNYRHDLSAEAIFAEYRTWNSSHAQPLMPSCPHHDLDRTAGRRLRVGYVSPDFRRHAAAHFIHPLLAAHDRSAVELVCYADVAVADDTTERFRSMADTWRVTAGMADADLADLIRRDRIDVLVDLAGHTGGNRLLTFARRPAPVQVESLLGLGTTSGMTAMDAFLADDMLVPDGAEVLFSERVLRLPRLPLAYQPPDGMPDVGPPPSLRATHVTFGYFGRVERLNPRVLAAWARILHAVPNARLMLNNLPFREPAFRELYRERFARLGISGDRLDLVCTAPQPRTWEAYGMIDIALDPFPHNAGTTTIEALWMGVPVVTRADRPSVGRFGAAILGAVGLDGWVAHDDDAYVARAVSGAQDRAGLTRLRRDLRARFSASPLRDAAGLARAMEGAYRSLWEAWRSRTDLAFAAE